MKLKPVQAYPATVLKGRVPGELHTALTAYATFYRERTGRTIDVWALVLRMVEQFIEADRDFETWRRRTGSGPGGGPEKR
jgi:hypothetical protein